MAGLVLAAGLWAAGVAGASERRVESFSGDRTFAARWPGASVSHGGSEGLSWLEIETAGDGEGVLAANAQPYAPALDARKRFVKIWLQVEDPAQLGGFELRLSSDDFASSWFAFPLHLYSDPYFHVLSRGGWTTLTFSFGAAQEVGKPERSAIDAVGLYVRDGGQAPLSVRWGGVSLVEEAPEGVLSLTFDDGYDEHHAAAVQMAKHGFRGTAYLIPESVGQPGYLSASQTESLRRKFGWDVAAHHAIPFTDLDEPALEAAILGVQRYLVERVSAAGAAHLAYPLGRQDERVRRLVRKHFRTARVAAAGPETLPPGDRHLLRVLNVTPELSPEDLGRAARSARRHKEWLILMFHRLVPEPKNDLDYGVDEFKRAMQAIAKSRIRVLPVSEVWAGCERTAGSRCDLSGPVPASSD